MMWYLIFAGGFILLLAVVIVYYMNKIYILNNRIENAWAQIDVQLKKRADLVPNLMETVKGYMKHEKTVFENITKARTAFMNAKGTGKLAEADNMLSGALKTLFAVSENYPKLRANENFLMLQYQGDGLPP
jgi:LemA protein